MSQTRTLLSDVAFSCDRKVALDHNGTGHPKPLAKHGRLYEAGVNVSIGTSITVPTGKKWQRLSASCARLGDGDRNYPVRFIVHGDGKELWRSGSIAEQLVPLDLDISAVNSLELSVEYADSGLYMIGNSAAWLTPTLTRSSAEKP